MTVSPGKLDSLMNVVYPSTDFTAVSVQSVTGATLAAEGATYSTLTLDTTGQPAPGTVAGETLTVVGFNDTDNSITFAISLDGQSVTQATDYVDGYSSAGLLLSPGNLSEIADASTIVSTLNNLVFVLSDGALPAQTSLTFTPSGTSNLTPSTTGLAVTDTTTGKPLAVTPQTYSGPVAGLTSEFITATTDSLNVSVTTPGWFIHTGSGNDAIAVSSGTNVLDGSTGSNFLTGGTGDDTFFVDDRGPASAIWSTVNNFHSGDAATIWGVTPSDFALSWVDGQGATGYTGLTLHATASGVPTASLTLVGFTSADLADGKLSITFGTTAASGGVAGSSYMYIHAT
jgi:Ca2+-binding RTX toxin-like protein